MRPGRFFPYPGFGGHFWWPHLLGLGLTSLLWLGLLGLLIWAVLRLARGRPMARASWFSPTQAQPQAPWQPYATAPTSGPSATEILRQRYARGEIDAVTFQQMLERLQASNPSPSPSWSPEQESGPVDQVDPTGYPTPWVEPEDPAHPGQPTEGPTV